MSVCDARGRTARARPKEKTQHRTGVLRHRRPVGREDVGERERREGGRETDLFVIFVFTVPVTSKFNC